MIAALALGATAVKAQSETFKPFRVGFDFGYAVPSGEGAKGGVAISLEPKYAISDKLALGLRMEAAVTVRGNIDEEGFATDGEAKASGSYLLTTDYYFNTNSFRPFVGLGAGIHTLASASFDDTDLYSDEDLEELEGIDGGTKLGVTPRVGFDYSHFRMAVDYNLVGKTGDVKNNYLNVKIGFFLGGGRR